MICSLCHKIESAKNKIEPRIITELPFSWVLAGDHQFYPGYCVLIAKTHVREMHDLATTERGALFEELMTLSRAISAAYSPHKINLVSLGNVDPHLHWHVFPRYTDDQNVKAHPWSNAEHFQKLTTPAEAEELRSRLVPYLRAR